MALLSLGIAGGPARATGDEIAGATGKSAGAAVPVAVTGPVGPAARTALDGSQLKQVPPEPSMVEMGTTGTGIFGQGYIRELGEYNELFSGGPFTAYKTYEKMRRSDAQVSATLMAMKAPVRCAEWAVQPPDDASPDEKDCAEFIEDCLFDDCDFDRSLENQLLALDFGSACHEDIWTSTNGQIRLARMAPRMPLTFYTWTIDQNEDLLELVQHGFHGGSFTSYPLPANKIALFTFRREGSNFAGRAIQREMYQHWYTKSALYKIDAMSLERNGMGVPFGELGPGAKVEDRNAFEAFLKSVAASQSAYVMYPSGYKFGLQGVVGQVRDCKESIQHHNMQISMAALNTFMLMGQGSRGGGNRSLGETMSDFFFLSLQSLANQVGDAYTRNTIARLAYYNFGAKVRAPKLVPQQIIAMKFESVVDALSKLGLAQVLTPDPDLEMWVRQKMGAPKVERAEIVKIRQAAVTMGKQPRKPGQGAAGAAEPGQEGGAPGGGKEPAQSASAGGPGKTGEGPEKGEKVKGAEDGWRRSGADRDLPLKREPRGAERCMSLSEIVGALDKGRDDVAAALRAARGRVQAEIVHKVLNRPVRQMHRASVEADPKLLAEVAGILDGVARFGHGQVVKERAKQRGGGAVEDAAKIRGGAADESEQSPATPGWQAEACPTKIVAAQDAIGLYADGVVSQYTNTLGARAANAAIDRKRKGGTDGEIIQGVHEDLDGQSDKWIDNVAGKGANEAFAEGRSAGFAEFADEIDHYIQSALLDLNTCGNCANADGAEADTEDELPGAPNPDCDGGDLCRCVIVAVFKDEGSKAA
jgi:phage gp29-like protein